MGGPACGSLPPPPPAWTSETLRAGWALTAGQDREEGTGTGRPRQLGEHFLSEPLAASSRAWQGECCVLSQNRQPFLLGPTSRPASRLPPSGPASKESSVFSLDPGTGAAPAAPHILRRPRPRTRRLSRAQAWCGEPVLQGRPPPSLWERKLRPREGRGCTGPSALLSREVVGHSINTWCPRTWRGGCGCADWPTKRGRLHDPTQALEDTGSNGSSASSLRSQPKLFQGPPSAFRGQAGPLGPDPGRRETSAAGGGDPTEVGAGAREGLGSWRVSRGGLRAGAWLVGCGGGQVLSPGTEPGGDAGSVAWRAQGPQGQQVGGSQLRARCRGGGGAA